MIQSKTILDIVDNSGAKIAKCIKILSPVTSKGYKIGHVGSIIVVSLRKVLPEKKIKKGSKYKGLIVTTKAQVTRGIGFIKSNKNSILLLNKNYEPIATRLTSFMFKEIRDNNFSKVISIGIGIL